MAFKEEKLPNEYEFDHDFTTGHVPVWGDVLKGRPLPSRILEIGSFEGRTAAWFIENAFGEGGGEVVCVDRWSDFDPNASDEGDRAFWPMAARAERRFARNMKVASVRNPRVRVSVHRGEASASLVALLSSGSSSSFDIVYVDGDHHSHAVMRDLVMAYELCKPGGLIICDDYLLSYSKDNLDWRTQIKLAIDGFVNAYREKIAVLPFFPLYQLYLEKIT